MKWYLLRALGVAGVVLGAVYMWGGLEALAIAAMLAVLEVALSFDNAVVNARVLEKMTPKWQRRFLSWGIFTSVGVVRLVFPVIMVSAVLFMSPFFIASLAFSDPQAYATLIAHTEPAVKAFGGVFLLLVALNYFLNDAKEVHWIAWIERRFARWGTIESLGIAVALLALLAVAAYNHTHTTLILVSGVTGVILFVALQALAAGFSVVEEDIPAHSHAALSGLKLFLYLDLLDAVFSLDGVVGAFALTSQLPVIVAGLGIGAYFVRSLTILIARGGALRQLIYLEHGAHYAIGALALCMLCALVFAVPESLTASVGLVCIAAAYWSSRRAVTRVAQKVEQA